MKRITHIKTCQYKKYILMTDVYVSRKRGRIPYKPRPYSYSQARLALAPSSITYGRRKKPMPNVRSLDKRIKKISAREELNHIDTFFNGSATSATGLITLLNGCVQGDTNLTRDGNEIVMTSIQWRVQYISDTDLLTSSFVRHLIIVDRQPNGAAPTLAQVLDSSVITNQLHSPYNEDFQKRFKILHDAVYELQPKVVAGFTVGTGVTTSVLTDRCYESGKRQLNRMVKYNGNAGTVADIQTNSLYSIIHGSGGADVPIVVAGFRLYFKDP